MKLVIGTATTANKPPFNIGALLIKWQQKTKYSHWYMFNGKEYMDSSTAGTRIDQPQEFNKRYNTDDHARWEINLPLSGEKVRNLVESHIKKPYAYLQNIGLAFMDWFGFEKNPFSNNEKKINCVELVAIVLKESGYSLPASPDSLDLNDMFEVLVKLEAQNKAKRIKL